MAEAPTGSGHDLSGRGNEMKNNGSVNNGKRGTDMAEARAMKARIRGRRISETMMVGMVDPRRCFLSLHELMRSMKKK